MQPAREEGSRWKGASATIWTAFSGVRVVRFRPAPPKRGANAQSRRIPTSAEESNTWTQSRGMPGKTVSQTASETMAIDFQQDIYELNLQYLMVLQRVAQNDIVEATMRFGIDARTAGTVCDASIRELQTVASGVVAMMSARPLLQDLTARTSADRADRLRAGAILRSISTPDR